jgi:hypothetical protein
VTVQESPPNIVDIKQVIVYRGDTVEVVQVNGFYQVLPGK